MQLKNPFKKPTVASTPTTKFQMVESMGNSFYTWNGKLYKSDVVRSAIRPKTRAIGKTKPMHIRETDGQIEVNPEPYLRFLLEEPNPIMTMQQLLERVITQLELNNNAFIFIDRDEFNFPIAIYPIRTSSGEILQDSAGNMYYRFILSKSGKQVTFKKEDVMHLGKDYLSDDIFGDGNEETLASLMEVISTTDQGIVHAIKNSNVIRWLLKFTTQLKPEDIKKNVKQFVEDFLSTEGDGMGAAGVDGKFDAIQVKPENYVPNEHQMDKTTQRIYSYFNTNEKIIQSKYAENDWIAYYESQIEPDVLQLSTLFTRHLFTREQRLAGNSIMFESADLSFASLTTRMNFVNNAIDRGYLNGNEGRKIFKLAPIPGGDVYVRRLDMAPTEGGEKNEDKH
ncbi:MAG: phage portal protein [Solibacillus sp.]|uniref:phage portal protein n=1 Tax=Solibacillus sp. TaxID=1909654 RepID=UPI003314526F